MSTVTPNKGYIKPSLTDIPNPTATNPNWDSLDIDMPKKLEVSNIIQGDRVTLSKNGNNTTINADFQSWDEIQNKPFSTYDTSIFEVTMETLSIKDTVFASKASEHTHGNLTALNTITQEKIDNWNSAFTHISDDDKHMTSDDRTLLNTVSDKLTIDDILEGTNITLDKVDGKVTINSSGGVSSWDDLTGKPFDAIDTNTMEVTEGNLGVKDDVFALSDHNHDDKYYTESEINTITGDLTTLDTDEKTNLVGAINEVFQYSSDMLNDFKASIEYKGGTVATPINKTNVNDGILNIPQNVDGNFTDGEVNSLETTIINKGGTVNKSGTVATYTEINNGIESIQTGITDASAVSVIVKNGDNTVIDNVTVTASQTNETDVVKTSDTNGIANFIIKASETTFALSNVPSGYKTPENQVINCVADNIVNLPFILQNEIVYLYNLGDECTSLTGGWKQGDKAGTATIAKGTDNIELSASAINSYIILVTTNKINTVGYTKLKMLCDVVIASRDLTLCVTTLSSGDFQNGNKTVVTQSATDTIVSVDLTNYQGEYYVSTFPNTSTVANNTVTIKKIWLE